MFLIFTFGLSDQGEDGDGEHSILTASDFQDNTWSYKAALKLLQQNDSIGKPDRTSVASIIAAARSNLKGKSSEEAEGKVSDNDDDDDGQSGSDSKGSDSEDSDEEDSDDDEVDDQEQVKGMQGDVLTVRQSKGKEDDAVEGESSNSEGETDNESDEDEDSSGSESENEEAKAEAEKAAKFFDNDAIDSSESVDVFAQLNLSRPLLRGVASIGFVSPTPIQTRVIPIALSGRDICAR